jgi:hypothetical protein
VAEDHSRQCKFLLRRRIFRRTVSACSYEVSAAIGEESMGMKNLVIAVAACSAGLAMADPSNPCNAPASAIKSNYIDLTARLGKFECAPAPVGAGTMPTLRSNDAGTVAWWYCPQPGGKWHANWAAATAEVLSAKNLMSEVYAVVTAKDPRGTFDAIAAKNVNLPLSDPKLTPVWCPFVNEMLKGAPPEPTNFAASGPGSSASSGRANPDVATTTK